MVLEEQHLEVPSLAFHIEDTTMIRQDLGMDQKQSISVFIIPSDGKIISTPVPETKRLDRLGN